MVFTHTQSKGLAARECMNVLKQHNMYTMSLQFIHHNIMLANKKLIHSLKTSHLQKKLQ
jgi:hypothetical protein